MIGVILNTVGVATGFGTAYQEYRSVKEAKAARKISEAHQEKAMKAIIAILEDEDICLGPAEDSFTTRNMYFGVQPDSQYEGLWSQTEDICFTRYLKSVFGEYEYPDEETKYDDQAIIKAFVSDQRKRGLEYLNHWIDQGLKPQESIVVWWLGLLK